MSDPTSKNDIDLLARARGGEARAFESLFEGVSERALLYVRLRLGRRLRLDVDSLDVLQETYLEAWRSLEGFEPRDAGAFGRWILRLAEHRIRGLADHFGAQRRRRPTDPVPVSEVLDRARATITGPATRAANRERDERLAAAVEGLDPDERAAVLLRFAEGRTLDDIAEILELSPTSVRRLLGRATARLGDLLEDS